MVPRCVLTSHPADEELSLVWVCDPQVVPQARDEALNTEVGGGSHNVLVAMASTAAAATVQHKHLLTVTTNQLGMIKATTPTCLLTHAQCHSNLITNSYTHTHHHYHHHHHQHTQPRPPPSAPSPTLTRLSRNCTAFCTLASLSAHSLNMASNTSLKNTTKPSRATWEQDAAGSSSSSSMQQAAAAMEGTCWCHATHTR